MNYNIVGNREPKGEILTWIDDLTGHLVPKSTPKKFYYQQNGSRHAYSFPPTKENLLLVANHFKYYLEDSPLLPDRLILIASAWFLTHLNIMAEDKPAYLNQSVLVYTSKIEVVRQIKKLYWILRDTYFPNQSLDNGHPVYYEDEKTFLRRWDKFHIISMHDYTDYEFKGFVYAISRQSSNLFHSRWPLIAIAHPLQPEIQNKDIITFKL